MSAESTREVQPQCPPDEALIHLAHGGFSGDALAKLEAHLDGCSSCRLVVAAVAAGSAPSSPDDTPNLQPGARLGRYEVDRPLGSGGMGVVYVAHDTALGRRVAVKLMRPHFGDEKGRARLLREAQAMAQLSHPNVVNVFDLGEVDERVFVAMELVEGGTLREWLKAPRSADAIRDVFLQAGEGLLAAHRAGLVHRDFKPENVLVGADGRARVTDFGLARPNDVPEPANQAPATGAVDLTQTGTVLGTPAYMSPEQLSLEPADARSDQYSFCVALFEALVGKRPYDGLTVAEVRTRVLAGGVQRPASERVADSTWRVLERGLRVNPAQRYPSMRELLDELRAPAPRHRPVLVAGLSAALGISAAALLIIASSSSDDAAEAARPKPLDPALLVKKDVPTRETSNDAAPEEPAPFAVVTEEAEPEALPAERVALALPPGGTRDFDVAAATSLRIADPAVADVAVKDGVLTLVGKAVGKTTLTVAAAGRTRTWPVVVRAPVAVSGAPLALFPGGEQVLSVPGLTRVSVANPAVADVVVLPPGQVLVSGLAPGRTNVLAWTNDAQRLEYVVTVSDDAPGPLAVLELDVGLQRAVPVQGLVRFSVGTTGVCEARQVGSDEVLLVARRPGRGTLVLWTADGAVTHYTVRVRQP